MLSTKNGREDDDISLHEVAKGARALCEVLGLIERQSRTIKHITGAVSYARRSCGVGGARRGLCATLINARDVHKFSEHLTFMRCSRLVCSALKLIIATRSAEAIKLDFFSYYYIYMWGYI